MSNKELIELTKDKDFWINPEKSKKVLSVILDRIEAVELCELDACQDGDLMFEYMENVSPEHLANEAIERSIRFLQTCINQIKIEIMDVERMTFRLIGTKTKHIEKLKAAQSILIEKKI